MSLRAIRTLWCDIPDCGQWHGQADTGEADAATMRRAAAKQGWTRVGNDDICQRHPQSARAPRVWPVDSPVPDEKGIRVRATSGVEFVHRGGFPAWYAEPPMGDSRYYTWQAINASVCDGMELTEVLSGGTA